jgi:undecaprenyl-diphosphatase
MKSEFKLKNRIFNIEENILLYVQNNLRNEKTDKLMKFITSLGDKGILWSSIAVGLAASDKYKRTGIKVCASLVIGVILTNLTTKNAVHRLRPFDVIDELKTLIPPPKDWSFPSGHTTSSIAAGLILFSELPSYIGIPALTLGTMISVSRIYTGVHYPSDVIAGAVAGIIASVISDKSVDKYFEVDKKCRQIKDDFRKNISYNFSEK